MRDFKTEILFDIDKTFPDASAGHIEAFREGIMKTYNIDTSIEIIDHQGMTDRHIILEVLRKNGMEDSEIFRSMDNYMEAMADRFDSIKNSTPIKILPGVPELLAELESRNFLIGLVTGNLERIAKARLERAGLGRTGISGSTVSEATIWTGQIL